MSDTTVYLISGANRGIGLHIVKELASDPANVIFAGARTPAKAVELHDLAKTSQAKIHVIELTSADTETNKKAAEQVKEIAGRVDVVIANAGIAAPEAIGPVHESDPAQWTSHYNVNVIGVVVLYKEFYNLLKASTVAPKFVVVSSLVGSTALALEMKMEIGPYATSKAAVNHATARIHMDTESFGLIAFPLHPGGVSTDMGTKAMSVMYPNDDENPFLDKIITPEQSAKAIVKLVGEATRETHGGKLYSYDGTVMPF